MTKYLRSVSVIAAATFVTIVGSNLLGLGFFGVSSFLGMIALALGATALAWVGFLAVALSVCVPLGFKDPGTLLQTTFGTISGAFALWLIAIVFPGSVLLTSIGGFVLVSFLNTMLVWLLAFGTGSTRKDLTFLPKR